MSQAGPRLLADIADRTTLTARLARTLGGLRKPRARHDPGRVLAVVGPRAMRGPERHLLDP